MNKVTPQQAIQIIKTKPKVLLLMQEEELPACLRTIQIIMMYEIRFKQLGFELIAVDVSDETSKIQELACIKIPQIRIFRNTQMISKYSGIPTEEFIINTLNEVY